MTNKERIEDLLTEFDEFGMKPTILVPDPEEMAKAWKHELEYETKLLRDEGEAWHKKCKELEIELDTMRGAANSLKMHYEDARAEAIKEFAERLKETPIKLGLPLLGLLTKSEIEGYFNHTLLQVRDAIDNLVAEMMEDK